MTFEDVWGQVKGLSDTAMVHVPEILSADTKRRLTKMNPDKVSEIVKDAIDEYTVNGYGIGTSISISGILDIWADYENSG